MKWYKKKSYLSVLVLLSVFAVWWVVSFVQVNRKYGIEECEPYRMGDTFSFKNMQLTWTAMELITCKEVLEQYPDLSQEVIEMECSDEDAVFCRLKLQVKNISGETAGIDLAEWTFTCKDAGNGSTVPLIHETNPKLSEGLSPQEEVEAYAFFSLREGEEERFQNYPVRVYLAHYPKRIFLEGEIEG